MIKGAIFDMDGLMIDSEKIVYESWQSVMDNLGYKYNLEIFKKTIGLKAEETEKLYHKIYGEKFDYPPKRDKVRQMFLDTTEKYGVPVKKGLVTLINFLKANNITLAVATSTSKPTAEKTLKRAKLYDYFDEFVFGSDVKNSKPHPEAFLTASKRLMLAPSECVAFEDSINGIKSANAAGNLTIMVPDFLEPTEEIKPLLNFVCSDLSKAIPYLCKNCNMKTQ